MNTATFLVIFIGGSLIFALLLVLLIVRIKEGSLKQKTEQEHVSPKGDLGRKVASAGESKQEEPLIVSGPDEDLAGVFVLYTSPDVRKDRVWYCKECGTMNDSTAASCKVCGADNELWEG